jgi:hypothetical protein
MRPTCHITLLSLALAVSIGAAAQPTDAADTPSALESAPEGWTDLLANAGPELKGWTRLPIPPTAKLKSETTSQWSLDPKSGYLTCQGDGGHEWLRFDRELGDLIYHVEWRFTPDPDKTRYNSGVFVRNSSDGEIWHQAQTGSGSGGFLFAQTLVDGKSTRINLSSQLKEKREKPAGEWNTFEVMCKGKQITLWVNGGVTSVIESCELPRGYVGLEAEGYRIEFRNVKLKRLD